MLRYLHFLARFTFHEPRASVAIRARQEIEGLPVKAQPISHVVHGFRVSDDSKSTHRVLCTGNEVARMCQLHRALAISLPGTREVFSGIFHSVAMMN